MALLPAQVVRLSAGGTPRHPWELVAVVAAGIGGGGGLHDLLYAMICYVGQLLEFGGYFAALILAGCFATIVLLLFYGRCFACRVSDVPTDALSLWSWLLLDALGGCFAVAASAGLMVLRFLSLGFSCTWSSS